jgi:hypothetical protein
MILDADIVAVSPAIVWRVLSRAGLLRKSNGNPSKYCLLNIRGRNHAEG